MGPVRALQAVSQTTVVNYQTKWGKYARESTKELTASPGAEVYGRKQVVLAVSSKGDALGHVAKRIQALQQPASRWQQWQKQALPSHKMGKASP